MILMKMSVYKKNASNLIDCFFLKGLTNLSIHQEVLPVCFVTLAQCNFTSVLTACFNSSTNGSLESVKELLTGQFETSQICRYAIVVMTISYVS